MLKACLKFPFQLDVIHQKKRALKKELLLAEGLIERKIAILGGSTTAEIKDVLELFLLNAGIKPAFYESEFNRYYEDLAFENQALKDFAPDIIYLHTTNVNISQYPEPGDTQAVVAEKLAGELQRFQLLWQRIESEYQCVVIQNNFEPHPYRALGNLDFSAVQGRTNFIMKLNLAFAEHAQNHKSFYINDINYLAARTGLEKWHDAAFWHSYKYALSFDAIVPLAHNIAGIIKAIYGKSKKVLVLDLDNTLWGGVIGDDGADNIAIGKETALAEAHSAFQQYVKSLQQRGVILAVCSKNDMETAVEGFNHVDSILKLEDFASFKANWDPKHQNIQSIVTEINIGADSLVFIDDNPAEREIVRTQMPEVAVPEVGGDIVKFIDYIDREAFFEAVSLSNDDLARSEYYLQNAERERQRAAFADGGSDYGSYLASLAMKGEIKPFSVSYLERITQLINKTNQFNLTTKRYTSAEVETLLSDENSLTLYGRLTDKFGDNGLVCVLAGSIVANSNANGSKGDELRIDLWLMSCRVIKRELELAMFDALVTAASAISVKKIAGTYLRTNKNHMVEDHYRALGFEKLSSNENGDSQWLYVIPENYTAMNRYIEIVL